MTKNRYKCDPCPNYYITPLVSIGRNGASLQEWIDISFEKMATDKQRITKEMQVLAENLATFNLTEFGEE
jgi:hypothetical protein